MKNKKRPNNALPLLVDTSAIVAIAHAKDERHDRAMALLKQADEAGAAFLLTKLTKPAPAKSSSSTETKPSPTWTPAASP